MSTPWALVNLPPLIDRTVGSPEVVIGLVDGPVVVDHPSLTPGRVVPVDDDLPAVCPRHGRGRACQHGTFIAGMFAAMRQSSTPGMCPGCTVLAFAIFSDRDLDSQASPAQLGRAIHRCVDSGVRIVNVSSALAHPRQSGQSQLTQALDRAAATGVLVIAAAGNEPVVGGSALTGHPWVIPVVGFGHRARPLAQSTLGASIGLRGLGAPGLNITGLAPDGGTVTLSGSSFAAPFVTGAAALLWSRFPHARAGQIRHVLTGGPRRRSVVPPLLDAAHAYATLERSLSYGQRTA